MQQSKPTKCGVVRIYEHGTFRDVSRCQHPEHQGAPRLTPPAHSMDLVNQLQKIVSNVHADIEEHKQLIVLHKQKIDEARTLAGNHFSSHENALDNHAQNIRNLREEISNLRQEVIKLKSNRGFIAKCLKSLGLRQD